MSSQDNPGRFSIRTFRRRLASLDGVPQFALLGILSGVLTGIVILGFRKLIEIPLGMFLSGSAENFEGLGHYHLFLLPFCGALFLAVALTLVKDGSRRVGVVHVLERLARHQGHLPLRNAVIQFLAGVTALATGQSGGREGPAIHLGAASSSLLGQYLQLPNNSIRILVGCGTAAAIAASFNTPVAGVIFSMEVIIMEYTIAGFIPVILSAVMAALVIQISYGQETAFTVPQVAMESFLDLPMVVVEGIFIGILAATFVKCIALLFRHMPSAIWLRLTIAGTVTGTLGLFVPEVLGIGYDTVNASLAGELSMILLISVCVFKLIATATSVAMGMPVGLIGPTLMIGAVAGGLIWEGARLFLPDISDPSFYVMLGMGAMMGAVLQAPLAALMAVMELTHNPNIILPAMLVIIIANLTASELFQTRSVFITQMELLGLEFRQNPLSMALNRASVASIMERSFARVSLCISNEEARSLLIDNPLWLLVDRDGSPNFILRTEDLGIFLTTHDPETIDLSEIPATRKDVAPVLLQATLSEALGMLDSKGVQALYVNRISGPLLDSPVGIVTREDIESYYQT